MTFRFTRKQAPELPREGVHRAEIVGFKHIGVKSTRYGQKDLIALTYQVEQKGKDGRLLTVVQNYTSLVSPNSNITKLCRVLDVTLTDDENDDESSVFIGKKLYITVQHESGRRKTTHARVISFAKTKGVEVIEVEEGA